MKLTPVYGLALMFLLALTSNSASSAQLSKQEICRTVAKGKENAVFITDQGDRIVEDLQLGEFDFSDRRGESEFLESKHKYRLIVRPRNIQLEEMCSLSACISRVEVPSRCPSSREYVVTVGLNPRKFVAGDFTSPISLRLIDSKYDDLSDLAHRDRQVSGLFFMPWAEVVEDQAVANQLSELIQGKRSSVDVELVNKGNRPLNLRGWDREDRVDKTITLEAPRCQNIALGAGARCKVTLRNASRKPVTGKYITWHNHSSDDDMIVSLYLTFRHDGTIEYNVKE